MWLGATWTKSKSRSTKPSQPLPPQLYHHQPLQVNQIHLPTKQSRFLNLCPMWTYSSNVSQYQSLTGYIFDQTILKSQTICKSLSLLIQFCYRDRQALDATMATVNVTFQAPDTLLAVDVESIGVDFRKRYSVF